MCMYFMLGDRGLVHNGNTVLQGAQQGARQPTVLVAFEQPAVKSSEIYPPLSFVSLNDIGLESRPQERETK